MRDMRQVSTPNGNLADYWTETEFDDTISDKVDPFSRIRVKNVYYVRGYFRVNRKRYIVQIKGDVLEELLAELDDALEKYTKEYGERN